MDIKTLKTTGILCPISALPNRFGIGDFGYETENFIKILKEQNVNTWQILPWHPSLQSNSPYRAISCYAGDEVYISLDRLYDIGLLDSRVDDFYRDKERVNYDEIRTFKHKYLKMAFQKFVQTKDYNRFIENNVWVRWYAIYQAFSETLGTPSWNTWPKDYKEYPKLQSVDISIYTNKIEYQMFLQYIFFSQWFEIKKLANENQVTILGDMPFYVDIDSVEVWTEPEAFLLDEDYLPTLIAGVPPDYFSETGQKWGNPIYNWKYLKENHFSFWIERLRFANQLFDEIRIDHFRAFDTYWAIPHNEETAISGKWYETPGYDLLNRIYKEIQTISLIAEDLGEIRDEVTELRKMYHIPGMKVFQFQLDDGFDDSYNILLYTGTHDNETVVGWYKNLDDSKQKKTLQLLSTTNDKQLHLKIIRFCIEKSNKVIIPIWDVLGLDNSARFNIPGLIDEKNWTYRFKRITEIENGLKSMNHFLK